MTDIDAELAELFDLDYGDCTDDLSFYEGLARRGAGPVLELGVGAGRVAVSFIGEGGSSLGEWHEAINLCAVRRLPAIFCVQNNQTALSTPVSDQSAVRVFADKAAGYGVPGITIDGTDPDAVAAAFAWAAERARAGAGPTLVELGEFLIPPCPFRAIGSSLSQGPPAASAERPRRHSWSTALASPSAQGPRSPDWRTRSNSGATCETPSRSGEPSTRWRSVSGRFTSSSTMPATASMGRSKTSGARTARSSSVRMSWGPSGARRRRHSARS
jgi:hypothetical protein